MPDDDGPRLHGDPVPAALILLRPPRSLRNTPPGQAIRRGSHRDALRRRLLPASATAQQPLPQPLRARVRRASNGPPSDDDPRPAGPIFRGASSSCHLSCPLLLPTGSPPVFLSPIVTRSDNIVNRSIIIIHVTGTDVVSDARSSAYAPSHGWMRRKLLADRRRGSLEMRARADIIEAHGIGGRQSVPIRVTDGTVSVKGGGAPWLPRQM